MPEFTISKEICDQPVAWLEQSDIITEFLRNKNMKTVSDVIDRQEEIPEKYMISIKAKLIFGISM